MEAHQVLDPTEKRWLSCGENGLTMERLGESCNYTIPIGPNRYMRVAVTDIR